MSPSSPRNSTPIVLRTVLRLWELESTSTGLTPVIETVTEADLTIRSSASQSEATKHQMDEPFNRTNMEAYIILGALLPATRPLKPNGRYGRQSYFTKDKQSRNTEKIETIAYCRESNFKLSFAGVILEHRLHTAESRTEASLPEQGTREHSKDIIEASKIET